MRLNANGGDIEEADIHPGGDEFLTADKNGKVLIWSHVAGKWTSSILLPGDGKPVFEGAIQFGRPSNRDVFGEWIGISVLNCRSPDAEEG